MPLSDWTVFSDQQIRGCVQQVDRKLFTMKVSRMLVGQLRQAGAHKNGVRVCNSKPVGIYCQY